MNKPQEMLTRDLLYPTSNSFEPGSIKVTVYKPDDNGSMPLYIVPRTEHSIIENLDAIIKVIQGDIFNRTRIDIKEKGVFYIEADKIVKQQYGCEKYLQVRYINGQKIESCATDIVY